MELIKTPIQGLLIVQSPIFSDNRGAFNKVFNADSFAESGLNFKVRELYYSVNNEGVIRGMHFQTPPADHDKLVWVSNGRILDVALDLRASQPTYGKWFAIELTHDNGRALFLPRGFAHGFATLTQGTVVNYAQSSCYSRENDCGVAYDSFGFEWPVDNPVISNRDLSFAPLGEFKTPFV